MVARNFVKGSEELEIRETIENAQMRALRDLQSRDHQQELLDMTGIKSQEVTINNEFIY